MTEYEDQEYLIKILKLEGTRTTSTTNWLIRNILGGLTVSCVLFIIIFMNTQEYPTKGKVIMCLPCILPLLHTWHLCSVRNKELKKARLLFKQLGQAFSQESIRELLLRALAHDCHEAESMHRDLKHVSGDKVDVQDAAIKLKRAGERIAPAASRFETVLRFLHVMGYASMFSGIYDYKRVVKENNE